ncbi:MAG: NUDIX domain-containing protein [Erysipelotrichales bacterium]|nr:NUDIX domain-containing protein [Erysipelotrichales bacterium]
MILKRFDDTEYPKTLITHLRHTVRIFLKTERNTYVFVKIKGSDDFGERNHIESIGGGIEGFETFDEALHREVLEETGYELLDYSYIGTIIDRYYLIARETHSHFFIGSINTTNKHETKLTSLEESLFDKLVELSEEEVLEELNNPKTKIANLIYQRDLLAFKNM